MNIKNKKVVMTCATILTITGLQTTHAADSQIAIIGEKCNVLMFSESKEYKKIASVDVPFPKQVHFVNDVYCAPWENCIYVASGDGDLFEIKFIDMSIKCQQICTSNDFQTFVWYNGKENRPAWLRLGEGVSASTVFFSGNDGQVYPAFPDDIYFQSRHVFNMHINGGVSSVELAARSSDLEHLAITYPKGEWYISGRSKHIAVYGLRLVDITKDGEPFKWVLLFQDKNKNKWRLQKLEEAGDEFVFNNVAIVKGRCNFKGNKEQSKPTGNWYFYSPKHHELAKYTFDPSWTVPYASAEYAIVVGGGKLMRLPLWKPGLAEPEVLAELPPGFVVAAVCPVLEDAKNTEE